MRGGRQGSWSLCSYVSSFAVPGCTMGNNLKRAIKLRAPCANTSGKATATVPVSPIAIIVARRGILHGAFIAVMQRCGDVGLTMLCCHQRGCEVDLRPATSAVMGFSISPDDVKPRIARTDLHVTSSTSFAPQRTKSSATPGYG